MLCPRKGCGGIVGNMFVVVDDNSPFGRSDQKSGYPCQKCGTIHVSAGLILVEKSHSQESSWYFRHGRAIPEKVIPQ
jgi:hypothetical protein